MEEKLSKFEEKIVNFLMSHYEQQFSSSRQSVTETKRMSKSRRDIAEKIQNSVNGFAILSEIIRISNITPDAASGQAGKKYVRQLHSDLPENIIRATRGFDLIGEEHVLGYFKNLQRGFASDVFSMEAVERMLRYIFVFHPDGILAQGSAGGVTYQNSEDVKSPQYRNEHKKYYRDMAAMLVEFGMSEVKKNLHPEKDRSLIDSLDLTVNMIKKLDYHVERTDGPKTDA